jgi:hypothetical protein
MGRELHVVSNTFSARDRMLTFKSAAHVSSRLIRQVYSDHQFGREGPYIIGQYFVILESKRNEGKFIHL